VITFDRNTQPIRQENKLLIATAFSPVR